MSNQNQSTEIKTDEHPAQAKALDLAKGNVLLINDRSREMVVVSKRKRQQTSPKWMEKDESKYHTVVELLAMGTKYHLVCTGGRKTEPMLYRQYEIDWDSTNKIGESPVYTGGESVESINILIGSE